MMTAKLNALTSNIATMTKETALILDRLNKYAPIFQYLKEKSETSFAVTSQQVQHELHGYIPLMQIGIVLNEITKWFPQSTERIKTEDKVIYAFNVKFYEEV